MTADEGRQLICKLVVLAQKSNKDMISVCILTHGGECNELEFSDGIKMTLSALVQPILQCRHLFGRPKLFFIQACREGIYPPYKIPVSNRSKVNLISVSPYSKSKIEHFSGTVRYELITEPMPFYAIST